MGRDNLGTPFTGAVPPGQGEYKKKAFAKALSDKGREGRAAAFQGRHGLITVVSGFSEQAKVLHVRAANGRKYFAGGGLQSDLYQANTKLAEELAEATVDYLQTHLRRPGVSSGRLAAALMAKENRYADQFGFGVGKPEFLDQSEAKYWRQIDQGFTGHLGRIITGVWGATLTGEEASARTGKYPLAGPIFSGFGASKGDRLRPMGRAHAYRLLRKQNGRSKDALRGLGTQGIIRRPIEPEQYFKGGWEEFDARSRVPAVVREVITKAFGGMGIPTTAETAYRMGLSNTQPKPTRRFR